ncbi:MAG: sporulation peptidase YabG [Clostridia bacterium]
MRKIKKGDIVGRLSYGKDIIFIVERIIETKQNGSFAVLKGLTVRIQADSPLEDLELIETKIVEQHLRTLEEKVEKRIKKYGKILKENPYVREKTIIHTGRILHIDGDKKYSEKSNKYYKKIGLNTIVKNIPEREQPNMVGILVKKYKPEILVITGHDGMIKKGAKFNDVYNYRNSRYFIKAVEEARKQTEKKDLVIFAGACQSYYEAIMMAGANFASSPARILIDFMDPLIVAENVAITSENKFVTIKDFEDELRDGQRGVSGIGGQGKKKILTI